MFAIAAQIAKFLGAFAFGPSTPLVRATICTFAFGFVFIHFNGHVAGEARNQSYPQDLPKSLFAR